MGTTPIATVIAVANAIFGSAILLYPISIVMVAGLIATELQRLDTEAGLRAQNAELTLSERRFLNVFDVSCIPMAWLDLKTTKFVRVNRQYEVFTGYSADELFHMTLAELSVPEDKHADLEAVRALASGVPSWQGERRYRCKDDSIRWGTRTLTASHEDGEPRFGFAIVEDITERKLAGEHIAYLAEHDHLTGLTNRFQFGKSLDRALADASSTQIAVIVVDLDDFKGVNDTRGHPVGDKVLMHIAAVLKSALDTSDLVSRIGGDEFAVTRQNATASEALALADHLTALIGMPFEIEGLLVSVQASAGIAMYPNDGVDRAIVQEGRYCTL